MFHILWMIIVGAVAGYIARAIMPEAEALGFWMTVGLGIVGSFIGGFISRLWSKPADGSMFHPAGIIMSIIGAIIVLYLSRYMH